MFYYVIVLNSLSISCAAKNIRTPHTIFKSGRVLVTRRLRITLHGCMAARAMCPTVFVGHVPVEQRVVRSLAWLTTTIPFVVIVIVVVRRQGTCYGLLHLLKQFQNFELHQITLYRVDVRLYRCC